MRKTQTLLAHALAGAGALLLAGVASAATSLPYSRNIPLLEPADGTVVEWSSEADVVAFAYRADDGAVLAQAARTGDSQAASGQCGTHHAFFLSCEGPACRSSRTLSRMGVDSVRLRVSDLLDLTAGERTARHAFVWGGEVRYRENRHASPPCVDIALAASQARLTLVRKPAPAGPPRLSLSVEPDRPDAWPKAVVVTDSGGPSKPTFLVVSASTLSASDPVVARNCARIDGSRTHTVEAMTGGGSKRSFDVPPLPPSAAQRDALLGAMAPAATATPAKGPSKVGLQPTVTFHDPNVHQVVSCQYRLDAHLGSDTNAHDPNKTDNALTRTIRIDVPLP